MIYDKAILGYIFYNILNSALHAERNSFAAMSDYTSQKKKIGFFISIIHISAFYAVKTQTNIQIHKHKTIPKS